MTEEEEFDKKWNKIYFERVSETYGEPAPETRERLAKLETNHTNIMEKIEEILIRFDKFEDKLDRALDKKANIWVEKVLIWLGVFIGAGILGYLGTLIIGTMNHLQ